MKKTVIILCCVLVVAIVLGGIFTNLSGGIKESRFNLGITPHSEINASDINEVVDDTVNMVDDLDDNIFDAVTNIETMGQDIEEWADGVEEWAEELEDDDAWEWRFSLFGWNWGNASWRRHEVDQTQTIEIQQVNNIEIHTVSSDINFYPTDDSEIMTKFYGEYSGRNMEPKLKISRQGDNIYVDIEYQTQMFNVNIGSANLKLDIYLPIDYVEDINIHTTSGNINLSGRRFDKFDIKTVSGDIELNDMDIDELEFKTTSGDIKGSAVTAKNVIADTVSGEVELNESTFGSVDIETTSGDVDISEVTGKLMFKTVSGQIDVDMKEVLKGMDIKTTSGDVDISLPNEALFKIEVETTSGSLNSNIKMYYTTQDKHDIEGYTDENGALIAVKTTSGDIQLNER